MLESHKKYINVKKCYIKYDDNTTKRILPKICLEDGWVDVDLNNNNEVIKFQYYIEQQGLMLIIRDEKEPTFITKIIFILEDILEILWELL